MCPWLTFWFDCSTFDWLPCSLPSPADVFLHNEHSCYNCDEHQSHSGQDNWNRIWLGILDKWKHKQKNFRHAYSRTEFKDAADAPHFSEWPAVFRHFVMLLLQPHVNHLRRMTRDNHAWQRVTRTSATWSCQNGAISVVSMSESLWKPWQLPRSSGNVTVSYCHCL